jgi:response regulator RpfG family c-di-GMP phosphodiesterase
MLNKNVQEMKTGKKEKSILIVEDEERFSDILKIFLEKEGFDVVTCDNGKIAKYEIALKDYDLILSDVNIPGGPGGMEILEYTRTLPKYKETPFILMTGFAKSALIEDANSLKVKTILSKPFSRDSLVNIIYEALNLNNGADYIPTTQGLKDEDFCKVSINNFISGKEMQYDIFIRASSVKYIKIVNKGDSVEIDRVQKYESKGLEYFYLKKDDFRKYIGVNVDILKKVNRCDAINTQKKLNLLKATSEIILEQFHSENIEDAKLDAAKNVIETCFDVLMDTEDGMEVAQVIKSGGDKEFSHQVAVSFYSVLIAKQMEWKSLNTLYKVSTAGFLHDIGEKYIPKEILAKRRSELTYKEIQILETHPIKGAEALSSCSSIPTEVIQVVLQHHEDCTGSGFPHRLRKSQICPLARLVAVADSFCDLVFKPNGISEIEALNLINTVYNGTLDPQFINALNKVFGREAHFDVKYELDQSA